MYSIITHKPVLDTLLDYLPTISQISLKKSLKLSSTKHWNIYERFYTRSCIFLTKVAKIDGNLLMKIFWENYIEDDLILSGGFILSVLQWDNFEYLKDIDVYLTDERIGTFYGSTYIEEDVNELFKQINKKIPLNYTPRYEENYIQEDVYQINNIYDGTTDYLKAIEEVKIGPNDIKVQQITLNTNFLSNPEAVLKKKTVYNPLLRIQNMYENYDNKNYLEANINHLVILWQARINSYRERGYNIDIKHQIDYSYYSPKKRKTDLDMYIEIVKKHLK